MSTTTKHLVSMRLSIWLWWNVLLEGYGIGMSGLSSTGVTMWWFMWTEAIVCNMVLGWGYSWFMRRKKNNAIQFFFSIFLPVHLLCSTSLLLGHVCDMCFVTRQWLLFLPFFHIEALQCSVRYDSRNNYTGRTLRIPGAPWIREYHVVNEFGKYK